MSEQQTYGPDSWQARGAHIAELERQAAENEAAIQDIHLVSIGEMRWLDWGKKHKAAIQRATERAGRVTGAA